MEDTLKKTIDKKDMAIKLLKDTITNNNKEIENIKEDNKIYISNAIKAFEDKLKLYNQREEFYIFEIKQAKEMAKKIQDEKEFTVNLMKKEVDEAQNVNILKSRLIFEK